MIVSVALALCPLYVAVISEEVVELVVSVVIGKLACVAPAPTVTVEGTVAAAVLPLINAITAPPAGAAPLSVTVPVDEVPPIAEVGLRARADTDAGFTVKITDPLEPLNVAVIVTCCWLATPPVVTGKVALLVPVATGIEAGTLATAELLLESVTLEYDGAAPERFTVPAVVLPPTTGVGFMTTELTAGVTSKLILWTLLPYVADMETTVGLVTAEVVMPKLAVVEPEGTLTLLGTAATLVLLLASITVPPVVVFNVTVPITGYPPAMILGLTATFTDDPDPDCSTNTPVLHVPA